MGTAKHRAREAILAAAFGAAVIAGGAASAAPAVGLPKTLAWTAYGVGSAGYAEAVAIGAALKNHAGITLRVLPGKNDVSRLLPLKANKVEFSAFGVGAWEAMEGISNFGESQWGPQNLQVLAMNFSDACLNLLIAGDAGVKTWSDLKGKRVAWVTGAPALNLNVRANLRFAGLDWGDVKKVEFGGYGATFDGIINGNVDAAYTISTAGNVLKVLSSPRGGEWLPFPFADKAAWTRLKKAAPYFVQHTCGVAGPIKKPQEGAAYPYPLLVAYGRQKPDMVYAMTREMFALYPDYKNAAPGNDGWALDRQQLQWVMPLHPGAIRFYKEKNMWSAADQAHQDMLMKRVATLRNAWKAYQGHAPSGEDAFAKGWMAARAAALTKAGLDPYYKTW